MGVLATLIDTLASKSPSDQRGAVGWLTVGIILGALLVIGLIIKLLIPGE